MTERTSPQVLVSLIDDVLPRPKGTPRSFYDKVRKMRRDPTIALARWLSIAPVLSSKWSVEAEKDAPEGAKDFINKTFTPLRDHILTSAFYGCIDFGWQGYEKVFEYNDTGLLTLSKLKPLLQDLTDILVESNTGSFIGLSQDAMGYKEEVILSQSESLLLNFEVEGTNWYGESTMSIVESSYDKWNRAEEGADRYDRKMAGSHWIVHYPYGTSILDGTAVDNFEIAKRILNKLESSGSIAVPRTLSEVVDDLNKEAPDAWKVELMSSQGGQTGFIERMKYLDTLKVRSFGFPERALLEGQFGTKAEAEVHSDIGLMFQEVRHQKIVQQLNWHCVNQLLRLNWGAGTDNLVYIRPSPLTDTQIGYLRDVYKTFLMSPDTLLMELSSIDLEAFRDRLGLPTLEATTLIGQDDSMGIDSFVEPGSEVDSFIET